MSMPRLTECPTCGSPPTIGPMAFGTLSVTEYDALKARIRDLEASINSRSTHCACIFTDADDPVSRCLYHVQKDDRIRDLETTLRDVLTLMDISKPVDADALTERVRQAWRVLGEGKP